MSEQDRARLYAWLCEQTDEPLAEYLMSCLAPAPLSDLATKADIESLESRFDQLFLLREADRKEAVALRDADRKEAVALREADRKEAAAQGEAFQRSLKRLAVALPFEIVVSLAAVAAVAEWLRG